MSDTTRALVVYRMEGAREALSEAGLLFQAGHVHAYVNRLYYARFYALLLVRILFCCANFERQAPQVGWASAHAVDVVGTISMG